MGKNNFKVFGVILNGSKLNKKFPVSLETINMLLDTAFLGTCSEIKFDSWTSFQRFITTNFNKRFKADNTCMISLHDIIEMKTHDLKPFTNSMIIFKVYDK